MVEVKVDVTGFSEGDDVEVGLPVVGFDVPEGLVSTSARVTLARQTATAQAPRKQATVDTNSRDKT